MANIERVDDRSLDQQFTAKRLIGQDVYDSSNRKIGEIRDVVLDPSGAQRLASGLGAGAMGRGSDSRQSWNSAESTSGGANSASVGATGAGASGSMSAGGATASGSLGAGSRASGSVGNSRSNGIGSPSLLGIDGTGAADSSGPAVIVSFSQSGSSAAGGNLLRVPLSSLNYDSSNKHIRLDVTRDQLSSVLSDNSASGSAAE